MTKHRSFPRNVTPVILVVLAVLSCFSTTIVASATDETGRIQSKPAMETIQSHIDRGKHADAETLARELLRATESGKGAESMEVAEVLDLLVESLWRGGKAMGEETEEQAIRALAIKEKRLDGGDPRIATSLNNLAIIHWYKGDYQRAWPLLERALSIQERALPPEHPDLVRSINNLALLLQVTGDLQGARRYYERALSLTEKTLSPDHPRVAYILNNLGSLLRDLGEFEKARRFYERALAINEKTYGPGSTRTANNLHNLAVIQKTTGDYEGARSLYERSLSIREKTRGPDHPEVADSLNNLATLMTMAGEYGEALPLYQRALSIREKALGLHHPDLAQSLHNLGSLIMKTGNWGEARNLLNRALSIREEALGPDHPDVAETLQVLINLEIRMDRHAEALPLSERSLAVYEKAYGSNHASVALALQNHADLLEHTQKADQARPLYERSLAIREKTLGLNHALVASVLTDLGGFVGERGDKEEAQQYFERALRIREKAYGDAHPEVADTLTRLAEIQVDTGNVEDALQHALKAETIDREHLALTARSLSEGHALAYASTLGRGRELICSLIAQDLNTDPLSIQQAWDSLIRSRALVIEEMAARKRSIYREDDPEITRLADELASARKRLAYLTVWGPQDRSSKHYADLVESSRRKKERAEELLGRSSKTFVREMTMRRIGYPDVTESLWKEAALVAYVKYDHRAVSKGKTLPTADINRDVPATPSGSAKKSDPSYMAMVFNKSTGKLSAIPLGQAREIDGLVSRWREEVTLGAKDPWRSSEEAEADYRDAGNALRVRIWDPLLSTLTETTSLLVVPDGSLHLVNLAALPVGESDYLIEKSPNIHYLSTERDLFTAGRESVTGGGLLALGGPDFDNRGQATPSKDSEEKKDGLITKVSSLFFRGERSACQIFQSLQFASLPAAKQEAEEIASLWRQNTMFTTGDQSGTAVEDQPKGTESILLLTGAEASEAAFKSQASGRRILHLATHGFFLGEKCPSALSSNRSPKGKEGRSPLETQSAAGENPLLLTGLALAGANHGKNAGPADEDGVLTAEEIASLDLSGVEWAVLSACGTGLGEVTDGEGVLGLRRAFQIAGVKTLIMSLWPVQDEVAQRWMRTLYTSRLLEGKDTAASVRAANLTSLEAQRRERKSTHPYYWASFVAVGDWK